MPDAVSGTDIFISQQLTDFVRSSAPSSILGGGARTLSDVAAGREEQQREAERPTRLQAPARPVVPRNREAVARLQADAQMNSVRLQSDLAPTRTAPVGGVEFRFQPELIQEVERQRQLAQETTTVLEEVNQRARPSLREELLRSVRQEQGQREQRGGRGGDRTADELTRGVMVSVLA